MFANRSEPMHYLTGCKTKLKRQLERRKLFRPNRVGLLQSWALFLWALDSGFLLIVTSIFAQLRYSPEPPSAGALRKTYMPSFSPMPICVPPAIRVATKDDSDPA